MIVAPETYSVRFLKDSGESKELNVEISVGVTPSGFLSIYPDHQYLSKKVVEDTIGEICYEEGFNKYQILGRVKYNLSNELS
jgi:hypothetical protein